MRARVVAVATAATLLLTGCSGGSDEDPSGTTGSTAAPVVLAGCEDGTDQQEAVAFRPVAGTHEQVDALMGRNYNSAGAPCLDVFVWDAPRGYHLDHYQVTADLGGGQRATLRSTSRDFIEALRLTSAMRCADVDGALVYRRGDRVARFTAHGRVCGRIPRGG
jgi:hypothetical protein